VKELLAIASMIVVLLASWPAGAQQGTPVERAERSGPPPQGRPMPMPMAPLQGAPARAPQDRMTPEERQQLRRDIHQHGRDVYRQRRQQGRQ
jgi:hypothetical protein